MTRQEIVVVACCFKGTSDSLCETTFERLRRAFEIGGVEAIYTVTGNVPAKPGGITLAELIKKELIKLGVKSDLIQIVDGVGIYSEAERVALRVANFPEIQMTVVSSTWYFYPGLLIWTRVAERWGLWMDYVAIGNQGGKSTRRLYRYYALVVLVSRLLGVEKVTERLLTKYQERRLSKGFGMDGCR